MTQDVDQVQDHQHQGRRHLERLVMLSDGVFAIAITLSAIEIKPEAREGVSLWQAWAPPLFIYFLSFFLIGVLWLVHRRIVAWLNHIDGPGTAINMVLLSLVALVPVMVRFALTYPRREEGFLVYALAFVVLALVLAVLWGYLAFVARLAPHASRSDAVQLLAKLGFVAMFFLAAALFLLGWTAAAIACVVLALPLRWLAWRSGKPAPSR
jgi:uncharacterized membrane protein